MNKLKLAALIFLIINLIGCGKNPLLGTWKAKSGQNKLLIICPEIIFTPDSSRCGSIIEEVNYDVQGNTVIVSSDLGNSLGMKVAYKITDKNTMIIDIPGAGKITYGRSAY